MDSEQIQVFSTRVTQANRSELVVITYEIILEEFKIAREAYLNQNIKVFETSLRQSQKFLNELMGSLNYQYEISKQLLRLYKYVNEQIIQAIVKKTDITLDSAKDVIEGLLKGFKKVSIQDQSDLLMSNTQKIYAGLTYGKGKLNETFVDVNESNRGFKA